MKQNYLGLWLVVQEASKPQLRKCMSCEAGYMDCESLHQIQSCLRCGQTIQQQLYNSKKNCSKLGQQQ